MEIANGALRRIEYNRTTPSGGISVPLHLQSASLDWAIKHLQLEGDTDLLPVPFEIGALQQDWAAVSAELSSCDVLNHRWKPVRHFLVPKNELGFRRSSQLDPIDSLLLAALMYECGAAIDAWRTQMSAKKSFAYWFAPTTSGLFYGSTSTWQNFWSQSATLAMSTKAKFVLTTDVSDFYNQVYHHVVENQLDEAVKSDHKSALVSFLKAFEHKVSRGIPVGPHAAHLLAELSLAPFDDSFAARGWTFTRYVDDIHVFCSSESQAQVAMFQLADSLDRQQKLVLNKQKTHIYPLVDYLKHAQSMLVDRPLNDDERAILKIVTRYSNNDPYRLVALGTLTPDELKAVDKRTLESLLDIYLSASEPNFPRIGWLLRRLAQIGTPGAVDYVVDHFGQLVPIIGVCARYLLRAKGQYRGDFAGLGLRVADLLTSDLVMSSEYLQSVLLSLFEQIPELNHFDKLGRLYQTMPDSARRAMILGAAAANKGSWLRERKEEISSASLWLKRALLYSARALPGDEGHIWAKGWWQQLSGLEQASFIFGSAGRSNLKRSARLL